MVNNKSSTKLKYPCAMAHGHFENLFKDIWFVKGAVKMPIMLPMKVSRSMTILRDPSNNELTLINSMRLTDAGLDELDNIGNVTNVIRIAGFHGRDDAFYREKYGAKIYAIRGQTYVRKFDNETKTEDGYMQADVWLENDSVLPIDSASLKIFGTAKPTEAIIILAREGGILVTGDSLQNTPEPDQYVNFPARWMMKKMGFFKEFNIGPGWLGFAEPEEAEVRSVLDLEFDHVLPAHGDPVITGAKEKYRPALEGDLKACHAN
ncbi:MAG: hypothetical protein BMS9Abin25_0094 [Gammaproteobacteria bacterium]|nr:MAG: hypothetical protein BMS9Abin25_0094 [Gammaproteobacteria bacterium]